MKKLIKYRIKLNEVKDEDVMGLRFILDVSYSKNKDSYKTDLSTICRWVIKTLVTEVNYDSLKPWKVESMKKMWTLFNQDKKLLQPHLLGLGAMLYDRVEYRIPTGISYPSEHFTNTTIEARRDMKRLLLTSILGNLSVPDSDTILCSYEFNKFILDFTKRNYPEYYDICMGLN